MWLNRALAEAMAATGDPAAVEPLIAALKDGNRWVRRAAARALYYLDDARAVGPLIELLGDEYAPARYWAAVALGELGDRRAEGPLGAALKDADAAVREAAAAALGRLEEPRESRSLRDAVSDEDPDVREAAIAAVGRRGDAAALGLVVAALDDERVFVRAQAAETLGALGGAAVYEPLLKASADANFWVRRGAALALAAAAGRRAEPRLREMLADTDPNVARAAREALAGLGCEVPPEQKPPQYWAESPEEPGPPAGFLLDRASPDCALIEGKTESKRIVVDTVGTQVTFEGFSVAKGLHWRRPPPTPSLRCWFSEILDVSAFCGFGYRRLWVTTTKGRVQVGDDVTNFEAISNVLTAACRRNRRLPLVRRPGVLIHLAMGIGLILLTACLVLEFVLIFTD